MDSIDTIFRITVQQNIKDVLPALKQLNLEIAKLPKGNIKLSVTGTSASVMTQKATAARTLATEITKLQMMKGISLNVTGNAKAAIPRLTAQTRQLKMEMGSLGGMIARTMSRFSFLATAIIAGYVHEALTTAVPDAAALQGLKLLRLGGLCQRVARKVETQEGGEPLLALGVLLGHLDQRSQIGQLVALQEQHPQIGQAHQRLDVLEVQERQRRVGQNQHAALGMTLTVRPSEQMPLFAIPPTGQIKETPLREQLFSDSA